MGLPDQVQHPACLFPHPHFPPPAACRPILPVRAGGHRPDGTEGRGKDAVLEPRPGKRRILHLDALQIHPAQRQPRQVETTQVPALLSQQRQHVGRSVALGGVFQCALLLQQPKQVLLQINSPPVHTPYLREQRSHNEPLLCLAHVFFGGGQFQTMLDQASQPSLLDLAGCLRDEPRSRIFQYHRLQREAPQALPALDQAASPQRLYGFQHLGAWQWRAQHHQQLLQTHRLAHNRQPQQ